MYLVLAIALTSSVALAWDSHGKSHEDHRILYSKYYDASPPVPDRNRVTIGFKERKQYFTGYGFAALTKV